MKKGLVLGLVLLLGVWVARVEARGEKPEAVGKGVETAAFKIPEHAKQVAADVYYLGKAQDSGEEIEGYAFVYRKDQPAKPDSCGNGRCDPGENINKCPADCGGGEPTPEPTPAADAACYGFLAKGAYWREAENYEINPTNNRGVNTSTVVANFTDDVTKWESEAGQVILGSGSETWDALAADTVTPDERNEVYFGSIDEPNVIGVTIVWGVFGGPPFNRRLVEWDMVLDEADFDWSSSGEAGKMDFDNIATHELGHAVGMADLYTSDCSEQTMYGYASLAETKKQSLEAGDIAGVQALYQ